MIYSRAADIASITPTTAPSIYFSFTACSRHQLNMQSFIHLRGGAASTQVASDGLFPNDSYPARPATMFPMPCYK